MQTNASTGRGADTGTAVGERASTAAVLDRNAGRDDIAHLVSGVYLSGTLLCEHAMRENAV